MGEDFAFRWIHFIGPEYVGFIYEGLHGLVCSSSESIFATILETQFDDGSVEVYCRIFDGVYDITCSSVEEAKRETLIAFTQNRFKEAAEELLAEMTEAKQGK
jgi:hypothetical protein